MKYPAEEFADSLVSQVEEIVQKENLSWSLALKIVLECEFRKSNPGTFKEYVPKNPTEVIETAKTVIEELGGSLPNAIYSVLRFENAKRVATVADSKSLGYGYVGRVSGIILIKRRSLMGPNENPLGLVPFDLQFKSGGVFFIFEHEQTLPNEGTKKGFLVASIVQGKQLNFVFKVLQVTNPDEIIRLINLLKEELRVRQLNDSEKISLEFAIESLEGLSR